MSVTPRLISQSRIRGFTLLELMVVMAIGAILFTFALLSVTSGQGDSALRDSARRLQAVMQLASEESILFNKSLGIKFDGRQYAFYELIKQQVEDKEAAAVQADNLYLPQAASADDQPDKPKYEKVWRAVEPQGGSNQAVFASSELPEGFEFAIYIEGNVIALDDDPFKLADTKSESAVKPTIFITPDGDIFPSFEIRIEHISLDAFASITFSEDGELELELDEGDA